MKVKKTRDLDYFKYNFISVDPGSEGTGLAFFQNTETGQLTTKILDLPQSKVWEEKCKYICYQFEYELSRCKDWLRAVYIEQPQYMATYKGQTAADSGSLFKLCTLYGRLWQIVESSRIRFFPVEIVKWKGQLDKKKVKFRVDRIIPNNEFKSHAIDAVGIGLYIKGKF